MKKKTLITATMFAGLFLMLLAPSAGSWGWGNHYDISVKAYHALPDELKRALDAEWFARGSVAPDEFVGRRVTVGELSVTFPTQDAHYWPGCYEYTIEYAKLGREWLMRGRPKEASWAFGCAAHFMEGHFAPPHAVGIGTLGQVLHAEYEREAQYYEAKLPTTVPVDDWVRYMVEYRTIAEKYWRDYIRTGEGHFQETLNAHTLGVYSMLMSEGKPYVPPPPPVWAKVGVGLMALAAIGIAWRVRVEEKPAFILGGLGVLLWAMLFAMFGLEIYHVGWTYPYGFTIFLLGGSALMLFIAYQTRAHQLIKLGLGLLLAFSVFTFGVAFGVI